MPMSRQRRREAEGISKRHRAQAGIVRASSVPRRGETDAYGDTFEGLPPDRLRYRGLTNDEYGTNSADGRVIAPNAVGSTQLDTRDGTRAVSGPAAQDGFLLGRHFPGGRIPPGVRMYFGEIDGTASANQLPEVWELRGNLGPGKVPQIWELRGTLGFAKLGGTASASQISTNAVGGRSIAPGAVGENHLASPLTGADSAGGPPQGNKGVRKIFGNGDGLGVSASNHHHSVSFEHLPPEAQDAVLGLRASLRPVADGSEDPDKRRMAAGLLALMHLALDDYEFTGEERREREKRDPAFFAAREQERFYHDTGGGEGMQRKRRFEREAHPDLLGLAP